MGLSLLTAREVSKETGLPERIGYCIMAFSMTGFGRASETIHNKEITVEIKSVNNRFFDCGVRIGHAYACLEDRFKPYFQSRGIARGKIDVSVSVTNRDTSAVNIELDEAYAAGYLQALRELRDRFDLPDDISVMTLAGNPALFRVSTPDPDTEADWDDILTVLARATDSLLAAREREGNGLVKDLLLKLSDLKGQVAQIEKLSEDSVVHYRDRLAQRVREALADNRVTPDESRLLTEVAVYADRIAIDEELVRLKTHFSSMEEMLHDSGPVGRKLDFLVQEMNREINTVGSKCNDAPVAALVVEVKHGLEKIREQIQNLE